MIFQSSLGDIPGILNYVLLQAKQILVEFTQVIGLPREEDKYSVRASHFRGIGQGEEVPFLFPKSILY